MLHTGDSGSPLIDDDTGVVLGVVSWGYGCGLEGYPGVYARTSSADDFIREGICSLSSVPPSYCGQGLGAPWQWLENELVEKSSFTCERAENVVFGEAVTGTTENGRRDSSATCGTEFVAKGKWYTFRGSGANVEINTCISFDFDTRISVFKGPCSSLACVADNDDFCGDGSSVSFLSERGTDYYAFVHGRTEDDQGQYTLLVESEPPTNDLCSDAVVIRAGIALEGSTFGATTDLIDNCEGLTSHMTSGVWYEFTGRNEHVTVNTCSSSFESMISIFTGTCSERTCLDIERMGCGAGSLVTFLAEKDLKYYILVHGVDARSVGDFDIAVALVTESPSMSPTVSPAPTTQKPGIKSITECGANVLCVLKELLLMIVRIIVAYADYAANARS